MVLPAMHSPYWSIQISISQINAWHNDQNSSPSLDFIPALQRRRLSALARVNLQLVHDLNLEKKPLRCVFASRHGEIQQTVAMLHTLARGELLSPAMFSHSVHNATQGLWSIQAQQTGECSAISAGIDTLPMAFLEAVAMLSDHTEPDILLMYSDEAVPDFLKPDESEAKQRFALACIIGSATANLRLSALPKSAIHTSHASQHDFFNWWQSNDPQLTTDGTHCVWEWTRL